ncbi:MAG: HAD-IB family hydrolase [Zoogloeaceae bacterium]|jgi:HAD superfamily hydrolase (TIGR01490 family)|nr:HAD-IB family hydrolase [Zoogloeaceae bacterium]
MTVIAAFDFDGTITTRDSFVPFLFRAFGRARTCRALLRLLPMALGVLAGSANRDAFKARLVRVLFAGASRQRLEELGIRHAEEILGWVRPAARERIEWHRTQGHRLIMVSASLELYLKPVAKRLGFHDLLCTTLVAQGDVLTGAIDGKNCRGAEKTARLAALLGDLAPLELYAYGDSSGDRELLTIAQHPHYRVF